MSFVSSLYTKKLQNAEAMENTFARHGTHFYSTSNI
jgi:hypothetical protein